jgi:hypothetical protein
MYGKNYRNDKMTAKENGDSNERVKAYIIKAKW